MLDTVAAQHPPLAFRVGVTGKRSSPPAVEHAFADVLAFVRDRCDAVAATPATKAISAAGEGQPSARLVLLSSLAEGADRQAARAALKLGYRLAVPMPFERPDYEETFDRVGLEDFPALLAQAESVIMLDGDRKREAWRAYDAAGRMVARNCDLLIAVWNPDTKSDGRGGTEDAVRFAVRIGVPVWLIDPAGVRPPALIERPADLRHPSSEDPEIRLATLIERRVGLAAIVAAPLHNGLQAAFGRLRLWLAGWGLVTNGRYDPLRDFLHDPLPPPTPFWSGYDWFLNTIAPTPDHAGAPAQPETDGWTPLYDLADTAALRYARRYRASYLYVLGLAAVAPVLAAVEAYLASIHHPAWARAATAAELVVLLAMLTLVAFNLHGRWHEKWISYRLLAELCRKQQALAKLGWSLPTAGVSRAINPGAGHASWVDWLFQAHLRAVPLATGTLKGAGLDAAKAAIAATLLDGQIAYHRRRAATSAKAAKRLSAGGLACFIFVLVLVAVRVVAPGLHGYAVWTDFALTIVAAVSAAFFAIRAYAEFELLADQSSRMVTLLEALKPKLAQPEPGKPPPPGSTDPLASQELGADLFHLAQAMLQDVAGWAQLFRLKAVETP